MGPCCPSDHLAVSRSSLTMNSSPSGRLPKGSAGPLVRTSLSVLMLTARRGSQQPGPGDLVRRRPEPGDETASVIDTRTRTVRPTPITVGHGSRGGRLDARRPASPTSRTCSTTRSPSSTSRPATRSAATSPSGVIPRASWCRPTGEFVYVANTGSDTISVIDTNNGSRLDGGPDRRALAGPSR